MKKLLKNGKLSDKLFLSILVFFLNMCLTDLYKKLRYIKLILISYLKILLSQK